MERGVESKFIMGNLKNIPQSVIKVDINNKIFWMACGNDKREKDVSY